MRRRRAGRPVKSAGRQPCATRISLFGPFRQPWLLSSQRFQFNQLAYAVRVGHPFSDDFRVVARRIDRYLANSKNSVKKRLLDADCTDATDTDFGMLLVRSEERRVGKECRG